MLSGSCDCQRHWRSQSPVTQASCLSKYPLEASATDTTLQPDAITENQSPPRLMHYFVILSMRNSYAMSFQPVFRVQISLKKPITGF